jgi:chromatin segregation and condensation protein Rec8/ScpA/Scc1 (kleisin family)
LAILELCKRGSVLLAQQENFAEIDIVRVPDAPAFELETDELTLVEEIDYDA